MIELRDVSYKGILKNINIKLDNNLIFVKGANGAGKSTLLDCISGVNRDYTGSIKGNDSIIYMNQNLYFDNRLKVKDFVQFIMELNDVKDYYRVFIEYVDIFNVKDEYIGIWNKQLGMLSGGERAKLFFTTLSMIDRQWYIFDEPYAGVDEKGKDYMNKVINGLLDKGKNIIITTHEEQPLWHIKGSENMSIFTVENGEVMFK